jgi:hypothetical protein
MFRHAYCAARLQTLDRGAPVSTYSVGRELGPRRGNAGEAGIWPPRHRVAPLRCRRVPGGAVCRATEGSTCSVGRVIVTAYVTAPLPFSGGIA